jgi:hypothetical protein
MDFDCAFGNVVGPLQSKTFLRPHRRVKKDRRDVAQDVGIRLAWHFAALHGADLFECALVRFLVSVPPRLQMLWSRGRMGEIPDP